MSTESPPESNMLSVQEELLEMLRSVGQEVAPPRREPAVVASVATPVAVPAPVEKRAAPPKVRLAKPEAGMDCPKCGSTTPWGKSSWCPDCGYYPAAGFEGSGLVEEEHVKTLREIIPPWVLPLAIGVVTVVAAAIATRFAYPSPLQRALTALFVLTMTSLTVALTHAGAVMFVMRNDGVGFMSVVNVTDTWRRILINSDKTRMYILFMGWGVVGVFSSVLIGLNIDLLADEMIKDMGNRPKPSIRDMISSFMRVTTKALGNPAGGGKTPGAGGDMLKEMLAGVAGGVSGGGGGGGGDVDLESAMGDFSEIAEGITEEGGIPGGEGGDIGGGDLESSISDLAGVGEGLTEEQMMGEVPVDGTDVAGNVGPEGEEEEGVLTVDMLNSRPTTTRKSAPTGAATTDKKESIEYAICGYTANPEGELRSLLLAQKSSTGRLKFVMKLTLEDVPVEKLEKMAADLEPFRIRNPAVACSYGGKWVNPVVNCVLKHDGLTAEKRPKNPVYDSLVMPPPVAPPVGKKPIGKFPAAKSPVR